MGWDDCYRCLDCEALPTVEEMALISLDGLVLCSACREYYVSAERRTLDSADDYPIPRLGYPQNTGDPVDSVF